VENFYHFWVYINRSNQMSEFPKEYFEGHELNTLVQSTDWEKLLPILYASTRKMIYKRYLSDPDKGILGKTFKDFVHDALSLFLEGKRKCPKDVKLPHFFLYTIRSIISKHIGKHYNTLSIDASEEEILKVHYQSMNTNFDIIKVKKIVADKLDKDEICINIFDCWTEGICKPSEIRELYGYDESQYNNAKKRLDRVLIDIRKHLKR